MCSVLGYENFMCVDLAGSERINRTGVEGVAQKQAVRINGSLTTLGKVVKAVGEHSAHVPYRDSTMTMLLRGALGGKSCTAVVIAVASEAEHAGENICSIEFGARMAVVRNHATVVVGRDAATESASACEAEVELPNVAELSANEIAEKDKERLREERRCEALEQMRRRTSSVVQPVVPPTSFHNVNDITRGQESSLMRNRE